MYIQTVDSLTTENKRSRKKITIIQKKKRSDGSVDSRKQVIYKDYGDQFARKESRRHGSNLECYAGSAKALQKVVRSGNSITILPDGKFNIIARVGLSPHRNNNYKMNDLTGYAKRH